MCAATWKHQQVRQIAWLTDKHREREDSDVQMAERFKIHWTIDISLLTVFHIHKHTNKSKDFDKKSTLITTPKCKAIDTVMAYKCVTEFQGLHKNTSQTAFDI